MPLERIWTEGACKFQTVARPHPSIYRYVMICIHIHHLFAVRGLQVETIATWGFLYAAFCFHKLQGHEHISDVHIWPSQCEVHIWRGPSLSPHFWQRFLRVFSDPKIIKHRSFVVEHKVSWGIPMLRNTIIWTFFTQVWMGLSGTQVCWPTWILWRVHETFKCWAKPGIPSSFHDAPPIVEVLSSRNSSVSICFSKFWFSGFVQPWVLPQRQVSPSTMGQFGGV